MNKLVNKYLLYSAAVFVLFSLIGTTYAFDDQNSSDIIIYGTVYNCRNLNETIAGVNVTAHTDGGHVISNITDSHGSYTLNVTPSKTVTLHARYRGHLESVKVIEINNETSIKVDLSLGQPAVTLTGPSESFINENFQINVDFDNNGTTPGFGPIVELILPPQITFLNSSYLGFPTKYVNVGIFPDSGELLDPLTRNITLGPPGYSLLVIEYPFGSFAPEQPPAEMITNLKMALNATVGLPLNITALPIFRFGNDPLDDPTVDPPIYGEAKNITIIPSVIRINKRAVLHEDETATGPNYPFDYIIEVDVADGATIENLTITDYLPCNIQFIELLDTAGGEVINTPSTTIPGGNITIKFPSITGVIGVDKNIKYRVYAPEFDNTTNPVLDPDTGAPVNATNNVTGTGTYNNTTVSSNSNYTVYLKSLPIQKTVKDINGGYTRPTDTLEYTLNFQLSDYFQIKDVIITDVVGDGQSFLETFTPILNITEAGDTTSTPFKPENYNVTHNNATGEWTITFNVSGQLKDIGLDEVLTGGLYENRSENRGPTTGTITFRTTIDIAYENPAHYPSGFPNLKSRDSTSNNVQVNAKLSHNNNTVSDPSGTTVTINAPAPEKRIYAINGNTINGNTNINPPRVRPGDNVTFSLWVIIPTTNICNLTITDFLPIPFFKADQITSYAGQSNMPSPGQWSIALDDNLTAYLGRPPELEVNATNNMLIFKYGPINSTDQQERTAHILFTVTATDEPFADELYLTNQMQITYYNSSCESSTDNKIQQVITQEPKLTITKNVNSTTGSGIIENGDLIGADAGDTITYKIIIENIGHRNAYNVTIKDNLTAKLINPQLISVTDGNGNPVTYTGDLFTTGINIEMIPQTDETPSGNDTIIVTFTAKLADNVNPREVINNTGLITYYASTPTGPNFVADQSLYEDNATVTITDPTMKKELISSTDPGTSGNNLTIGEQGTFQITITLPEGETNNLTIIETLPTGLKYNSYELNTTGFNGTLPTPTVTINGNNITFLFNGTTIVYLDNDNSTDSFRLNINASVENNSSNPHQPIIGKTNTVNLNWYANPGNPITTNYNFNILQPILNITKTITPNPARGRQTVTIRFNVTNNGLSPAYNVYLWDVLNSTAFNLTTVTQVTTPPAFSYNYNPANGTVEYIGGTINPGQNLIFEFNVTINDNVKSNSTFPNRVNATYDSLDSSTVPRTDNRIYNTSATTTLRTLAPSISKAVNATSEPDSTGNNVFIGEVVTYRIDITIPAGVTAEVTIRDPIDTRYIEYIPGRSLISRSSGNITADNFNFTLSGINNFESINETTLSPLRFYLGNVTNNNPQGLNETIRLLIQVVVKNNGNNTAGRSIPNTAYLDYKNDAGTNLNTSSSAPRLTVRLPALYVNKTSNQTIITPGSPVKFTLTIGNSLGTNIAPIYDLNITDNINPWFENIRNITITKSNPTINVTYNLTGNNLTAYIDCLLQGQNVNITFTADLREDAIFSSTIQNTMEAKGTSLPGPHGTNNTTPGDPGTGTGERTGDGGINNLRGNSTIALQVTAPTITKTFIDNSNLKESPIGNTSTQRITISVPIGRTENLTVNDMIPTGLEPSNFTYNIDPNIQVQYPTPTPIQTGNKWTINFGEVNATAPGTITILYNITVLNIPENINNKILTNNATITYYNGTHNITSPPASASIKIIEPMLNIQKNGTTNLNPGDTCTWTIQINHNTTSTSNAYDITIEDILPTGMNYNETISLPPGWNITIQPNKIIYKGPILQLGEEATIIFTTTIDNDPSLAAKNLTNTVNITYTSLPGEISQERLYNGTTNATIHILGTDLEIQKIPSKTSPNYLEIITYTIQVKNNGPDTANYVIVEDPLPNTVIYINNTKSK